MQCGKCQCERIVITDAGPHKKASCADCGAYIKFVSKGELQFLEDVEQDMEIKK